MPAILTHDFFGREVLRELGRQRPESVTVPTSNDERDAFLLGNQGPDPLFYLRIDPVRHSLAQLGGRMHGERTDQLLERLHESLAALNARDVPVTRAWAQGFLCHYLLDSRVHPLVYCQQFRICDAGVPRLTREDGSAVHNEIERVFDQMVLYRRYGLTVADYSPAAQTLHASDAVLDVVGLVCAFLISHTYGIKVDADLYGAAVRDYRFGLQAMYSPQGTKRNLLGVIERVGLGHRYSAVQAMSHRAQPVEDTWLANPDREAWENPWTGADDTRSFDDLYVQAQGEAIAALRRFERPEFGPEDVRAITGGVNFAGKPLEEE